MYVGCWSDVSDAYTRDMERLLNPSQQYWQGFTLGRCIAACYFLQYRYAAMQVFTYRLDSSSSYLVYRFDEFGGLIARYNNVDILANVHVINVTVSSLSLPSICRTGCTVCAGTVTEGTRTGPTRTTAWRRTAWTGRESAAGASRTPCTTCRRCRDGSRPVHPVRRKYQ